MALSLPFTHSDIASELGLSAPWDQDDMENATLNDCSPVTPDQSTPWAITSWDGYDHSALAPVPGGISSRPGDNVGGQDEQADQDSSTYTSWNAVLCASSYDVQESTAGAGGPYTIVSNDQNDEYINRSMPADTLRHLQIRSNAGGTGTPGNWSSAIAIRTAPTAPQSFVVTWIDETCANPEARLSWSNGTSPGLRRSKLEFAWRKNGTGGWSSWLGPTAVAATQHDFHPGGSWSDGDYIQVKARWQEETAEAQDDSPTITCFA